MCQGRIARLGSHTIETAEGDQETFTIWRCHLCFTTYLGDWFDRWVRLDSLETQEAFFRIAPADAADLLHAFETADRSAAETEGLTRLEANLRRLIGETEPLSRQVKLGR